MAEGMRRIVVDGQPFRWRFDDVLVVIPGDRSGPQLYVDWGWRDWLEPDGPGGRTAGGHAQARGRGDPVRGGAWLALSDRWQSIASRISGW
jgi:hypothetical protein